MVVVAVVVAEAMDCSDGFVADTARPTSTTVPIFCTGQNKVSLFRLYGSILALPLRNDSFFVLFQNNCVLGLANFLVEYGGLKAKYLCFYICSIL